MKKAVKITLGVIPTLASLIPLVSMLWEDYTANDIVVLIPLAFVGIIVSSLVWVGLFPPEKIK